MPACSGPTALSAILLATLVPVAAATDDLTVEQAEARVVSLLNAQRKNAGRIVLRVDPRLSAIARGRSEDMASKGYFSHQQPDGDWAWDLMTAAGIRWFGAGEIIAWNNWGTLADSATSASQSVARLVRALRLADQRELQLLRRRPGRRRQRQEALDRGLHERPRPDRRQSQVQDHEQRLGRHDLDGPTSARAST